jgi:hypothetical protein
MEAMAKEEIPQEYTGGRQVDFQRLRKAAIIYLKDLRDRNLDGGPKLNVLRDAIGHAEWSHVAIERRQWCLGRGCPGIPYKQSKELAHINWEDHPSDVRRSMAANVLEWIIDED